MGQYVLRLELSQLPLTSFAPIPPLLLSSKAARVTWISRT